MGVENQISFDFIMLMESGICVDSLFGYVDLPHYVVIWVQKWWMKFEHVVQRVFGFPFVDLA